LSKSLSAIPAGSIPGGLTPELSANRKLSLRTRGDAGLHGPIGLTATMSASSIMNVIRHGITMARRGWLEKANVINSLAAEQFLAALRAKPGAASTNKKHAAKAHR
jgi:hypothetical protein